MSMEEIGAKLILAGQQEFMSGMQKAQDQSTGFGRALGKVAEGIAQGFGQSLFNAVSRGIGAIPDLMTGAIKAASDLNETVSKAGVVFGKNSFLVELWGKSAASAMGMSSNEAIGAAATYGNLFKSMGMTEKATFDMSLGLVELAGDLSSFNNIPTADVLEKLRAGLTGESEPLKSLGVNINEAAIQQKALNMHLMTAGGTLTASAKAQAVYALVLEQTTTAQGDFARTSTGLANQQRIFAASLENTKAALGTALLPIVNKVMNAITKLFNNPAVMEGIKRFTAGIAKIGDMLSVVFDGLLSGDFQSAFDDLIGGTLDLLPKQFQETGIKIANFITSTVNFVQDNWPKVQKVIDDVMGFITSTIQSGLQFINDFWQTNSAEIIATVQDLWGSIQPAFEAGIKFIQTLVSFVLNNIQLFWKTHGDQVMAVVNWLWTTIQTIFKTAMGIITSLFEGFTDLLQGNWAGFGQHLLDAWNQLWVLIQKAAVDAWDILKEIFIMLIHQIIALFTDTDWGAIGRHIIEGIGAGLAAMGGWLAEQASAIVNGIIASAKASLANIGSGSAGNNGYTGTQYGAYQNQYGIGTGSGNEGVGWGGGNAKYYAEGGSYKIPVGFHENYPVGMGKFASSGETVTITPKNVSAGPVTNNYNYQTSYNLNLSTLQSAMTVQQSFSMMKLLAG